MNDRRPFSLLQIRELGHGTHDLPEFDTNSFRPFAVRLDRHENRLPIDRSAETLDVLLAGRAAESFLAMVSRRVGANKPLSQGGKECPRQS